MLVPTFIPDVLIWALRAYSHAATAETVVPLMIMHLAAASVCGILLPWLASHQRVPARAAGRPAA